ncbi:hypothetical protein PYJP_16100 [Pyrofollis japonicus]|uniref:hypothetical protein n=1 Tax=Pyrofollis japonicus TaxID=3060460 RepID=UPI00295B8475|nr:hypothetical protein [Pyrofollis japonicus]BEP18258.1 hypothetical protein PYJP_16100 [Pyrofollis japonicus]
MSLLSPPCRAVIAVKNLTVTDEKCGTAPYPSPLLDVLYGYGVGTLCFRGRRFPRLSAFREILLRALIWGGCIQRTSSSEGRIEECTVYKGRRFCAARLGGRACCDAVFSENSYCSLRKDLLGWIEDYLPLIVIDMSLLREHRGREIRSLRVQIGATLGVVRRFLWDRHLLIAGIEPGVAEWLRAFMGRALVDFSVLPGDEAAELRGAKRIILLDPSADRDLGVDDVLSADAFVLGGIVDILPRPGATRRLKLRGIAIPRRISLRGDIHGVPSRLNQLVEIILRARYETCGDIEQAIRSTMSPRDARLRAYIELMRWSRGRRREVPVELYYELKEWLPLSLRDFIRAAKMAGLEVKGVQQRPKSSRHDQR